MNFSAISSDSQQKADTTTQPSSKRPPSPPNIVETALFNLTVLSREPESDKGKKSKEKPKIGWKGWFTGKVINNILSGPTDKKIENSEIVNTIGYFDNGRLISVKPLITAIAKMTPFFISQPEKPKAEKNEVDKKEADEKAQSEETIPPKKIDTFLRDLAETMGENLPDFLDDLLTTAIANLSKAAPHKRDQSGQEIPHTLTDVLNHAVGLLTQQYQLKRKALESAETALQQAIREKSEAEANAEKENGGLKLKVFSCENTRNKVIQEIFAPFLAVAFPEQMEDLIKLVEDDSFLSLLPGQKKIADSLRTKVWNQINNPQLLAMLFDLVMDTQSDMAKWNYSPTAEAMSRDGITILRGMLRETPSSLSAQEVKERASAESDRKASEPEQKAHIAGSSPVQFVHAPLSPEELKERASREGDSKNTPPAQSEADAKTQKAATSPTPKIVDTTLSSTLASSIQEFFVRSHQESLGFREDVRLSEADLQRLGISPDDFRKIVSKGNETASRIVNQQNYQRSWETEYHPLLKHFFIDLANNPSTEQLWSHAAFRISLFANKAITSASKDADFLLQKPQALMRLGFIFAKFYLKNGLRLKQEYAKYIPNKPGSEKWVREIFEPLSNALINAMGLEKIFSEKNMEKVREKLPNWLCDGYGKLLGRHPEKITDWFFPESQRERLHKELESTTAGRTSKTLSTAMTEMAFGKMLALVKDPAITQKSVESILNSLFNNIGTIFPSLVASRSIVEPEVRALVSSLLTFGLRDETSEGLRQFIKDHIEITFLRLFATIPAPSNSEQPSLMGERGISLLSEPPVAPKSDVAPAVPSLSLLPSADLARPEATASFDFIVQCSSTVIRFFQTNHQSLQYMHQTMPPQLKLILMNGTSLVTPEAQAAINKILETHFGKLADDLIKELRLDQQAKLHAFNLLGVIRSQMIRGLYDFHCRIDRIEKSLMNTDQELIEFLHRAPNSDKQLEELHTALGKIEGDQKRSSESDKAAKEDLHRRIRQREMELRQESGALPMHAGFTHASRGVVVPFIKRQTQSFLTNHDLVVTLLDKTFNLNLNDEGRHFIHQEIQRFAQHSQSPEWQMGSYFIHIFLMRILTNYLESAHKCRGRLPQAADNGVGLGLLPPPPQEPIETIIPFNFDPSRVLVALKNRICDTVCRTFVSERVNELVREEREARANVRKHEAVISAAQAEKRVLEGLLNSQQESKERSSSHALDHVTTAISDLNTKCTSHRSLIEVETRHADHVHKQFINQFLPVVNAVFEDLGTDPSFGPLISNTFWKEKGPAIAAEWIANKYYEGYRENPQQLRAELFNIYGSYHAGELCKLLGIMTQDRTSENVVSNAANITRNTFDFLVGVITQANGHNAQNSIEQQSVRNLLQLLTNQRVAIDNTLQDNVRLIGNEGIVRRNTPDSRPPHVTQPLSSLGDASETGLLKFMFAVSKSLKMIDDHAPEFMQDIIPRYALNLISQHTDATNRSVTACKRKHLRQVTDLDQLKRVYKQKLSEGAAHPAGALALHPSLAPIDLTPAETQGKTPVQIAALKKEREEEQRMELLYKPLVAKLLELGRLTAADFPGDQLTLDQIKKEAPKILRIVYEKICSPSLFHAVTTSLAEATSGACEKIVVRQSSSDFRDREASHEPDRKEEADQKSAADDWSEMMNRITTGLPGMNWIMNIPVNSDGLTIQDILEKMLKQTTKDFIHKNPIISMIRDFVFKPTLVNMHPGTCDTTGKFFPQGEKIEFPSPKDKAAEEAEAAKDKERNAFKETQSIAATRRVIMLGIDGNSKRLGNAFYDTLYRNIPRIADIFFCSCLSPVKRVVKRLIEELIGVVRMILQIPFYPFQRLFFFIYESYVAWQVPLLYQNIRHPINENLTIQLMFLWLDKAIDQVKEIERKQLIETANGESEKQEKRRAEILQSPPSPVFLSQSRRPVIVQSPIDVGEA